MQKQYNEIKAQYPGALLLFRLGDFYECFDENAEQASKILGIALTKRGKGENKRPMAGIPHHALNNYLPKLVQAGVKVVIVDQVSTPEPGKLVEREVTEVISPGAVVDENLLKDVRTNYLAAVNLELKRGSRRAGVILVDVGTGEILAQELEDLSGNLTELREFLGSYRARELLISEKNRSLIEEHLSENSLPNLAAREFLPAADFAATESWQYLTTSYELASLKGFGIGEDSLLVGALAALKRYLETELHKQLKLEQLQLLRPREFTDVPVTSYRALDVFRDSSGGTADSLFTHLNHTRTPGGARLLEEWLLQVERRYPVLAKRWLSVAEFCEFRRETELAAKLAEFLDYQPDYARMTVKYDYNRMRPADVYQLGRGIQLVAEFATACGSEYSCKEGGFLADLTSFDFKKLLELAQNLTDTAVEGVYSTAEPGFINPESDARLAELASETKNTQQFLEDLRTREAEATGIQSLKVSYNKVFGYYLEVSKTHTDKVPSHYVRKQTLVNAERYITDELKQWEDKLSSNFERRLVLEQKLWTGLLDQIAPHREQLLELGRLIAIVDVLVGFADLAVMHGYVQPEVVDTDQSETSESEVVWEGVSHPVLKAKLGANYVPNSVRFKQNESFYVITGPNMAGKSTYIRSVAIAQLMAQIGSFVPAASAKIKLVDGIYTRVGAADNLAQNESTFMTEMLGLAQILRGATADSLVILDEVGRGTSTYDGVALAWALTEHFSQKINCQVLFATHYHELIELEQTLPGVKNLFVEATTNRGKLVFTHKVKPGSLNKSFGVAVAKLAGVDSDLVARAAEVLKELERTHDKSGLSGTSLNYQQLGLLNPITRETTETKSPQEDSEEDSQAAQAKEILAAIEKLDLDNTPPIQVVAKLQQILASD